MFEVKRVERTFGEKKLILETGKIAKQAAGSVVVSMGDTMVLVTVCTSPPQREDIDYFPLSVDYREKLSAAGKFPGGFMKREGRPTTKEVLTSRMIDRPIRPLFPDGYFNEVQILANVMSADQDNDPDVLAMIGASAALSISPAPFMGPLGACRLSRVDGHYVLFPTHVERERSDFNLVLGGRKEAINMIEVDAVEVPEADTADAIQEAHQCVGQICDMINELKSLINPVKEVVEDNLDLDLAAEIEKKTYDGIVQAYHIDKKLDRSNAVSEIRDKIIEEYCTPAEGIEPKKPVMVKRILENVEKKAVRDLILKGRRPDGRDYTSVRPIECEVAVLPRAHGSALFTRGETQSLISVTLGTTRDEQIVDGLLEEYGQRFMLHYYFPPSSVGEVRPIRGPGRREIGHGALAEKALERLRPTREEFNYTVKIVSEITESNGSSSMASVCGGSLALMDAGVPYKSLIAGISIGMVTSDDGSQYKLLTDIIGDEDHFGDMDFKVAGTPNGISAIQLDIKAMGLPHNILVEALARAREARLSILDIMSRTISEPRPELSDYAPRLVGIKIDPEYIGKVIGPGGKMIKSIQEQTGTLIEIEEDGNVTISCVGGTGHLTARDIIESMTTPPKIGRVYEFAKVVSAKDFGVFVEIAPGVEGLCHISELSKEYIKTVDSVCKVGDTIPVKLINIDEQGRLKLSRKAALADLDTKEKKEVSAPQKS